MRHQILMVAVLSSAVPAAAQAESDVAAPYVASRDPADFEQSLQCLTQAVYYEARNQSDDGQRAVAQVVLNRVRHPSYPDSVCGVVFQGSQRTTGCQFSFTCDGSMYRAIEPVAWSRAEEIARSALAGSVYRPVGLALNYHATYVRPYWAPSLRQQAVVGDHIFYRRPGSTAESFTQTPGTESEAGLASRDVALRATPARAQRPQYEIPVLEIPVLERPVRVRTASAQTTTRRSNASRRASAPRAGTRVSVESGVRVARGF